MAKKRTQFSVVEYVLDKVSTRKPGIKCGCSTFTQLLGGLGEVFYAAGRKPPQWLKDHVSYSQFRVPARSEAAAVQILSEILGKIRSLRSGHENTMLAECKRIFGDKNFIDRIANKLHAAGAPDIPVKADVEIQGISVPVPPGAIPQSDSLKVIVMKGKETLFTGKPTSAYLSV